MELHTAGHRRGVVAAPHRAAAEAGRAILAEGGNAIEAMVAMAATIAVVYPHMNDVGGDGFWLVRERSGRVRALRPAAAPARTPRIELYREEGYDTIPPRGPLAALTVPGAVGGWTLALDVAQGAGRAAAARHAARRRDPPRPRGLYGDRAARRGSRRKSSRSSKDVPGFAATFLADGKPPAAGAVLRQPALAATLDHLAHAGLDDFYRGDVGREIAADLERIGSPVTRADLEALPRRGRGAADASRSPPARSTTCRRRRRGWPRSSSSALFDAACASREAESFDHVHGLIEATKRAFRVRDRFVTDPDRLPQPPARFLEPEFLDAEAAKIDRRKAAPWPALARRGRHGLDGRGRRQRARRLLHPVDLLGVRLRLRAAARPAC